jgi:hypothetical protein
LDKKLEPDAQLDGKTLNGHLIAPKLSPIPEENTDWNVDSKVAEMAYKKAFRRSDVDIREQPRDEASRYDQAAAVRKPSQKEEKYVTVCVNLVESKDVSEAEMPRGESAAGIRSTAEDERATLVKEREASQQNLWHSVIESEHKQITVPMAVYIRLSFKPLRRQLRLQALYELIRRMFQALTAAQHEDAGRGHP